MAKDGGVMASVGVIGSGTWGTALAILLNGNGHKVQLWSAVPAEVEIRQYRKQLRSPVT